MQRIIILLSVFLFVYLPYCFSQETSTSDGDQQHRQASHLEQEAIELISKDRMDEGLSKMRAALALEPTGSRHLNYGSILFGNGTAIFKSGDLKQGKAVLKEAEGELRSAIDLFDPSQNATQISQCYFLLGEIYAHALKDSVRAKEFYEQSLSYYDNGQSKEALELYQ